ATLEMVLAKAGVGIQFNEHMDGDGETVFRHACKLGLEGIVSKRKDSAYRSGRSPDWLKMKNTDTHSIIRQSLRKAGKYRGKTCGRPAATNHCKFPSSPPRVPDDGRDRAFDGGRQEVQPLRPSGCDYDPDRLSARLAGVRVVRSAMVAG